MEIYLFFAENMLKYEISLYDYAVLICSDMQKQK